MTSLLARCRIACQIATLSLLGLLGMAAVVAVNLWSDARQAESARTMAAAREASDIEGRLQMQLLQLRRFEKDFLLRRDDKSIAQHAAATAAATTAREELAAAVAGSPKSLALLAEVRAGMDGYAAAFVKLVQLARRVGLNETDGLLGELRKAIREAEQMVVTVDAAPVQVRILMMRRHEKDFLARLDARYVGELKAELPRFMAALAAVPLPDATRADIIAKVTAYQASFARLAEARLQQEEAARELSRVYAEFEPVGEKLDELFADQARAAEAEGAASVADARQLTVLVVSLVVLVATVLSWIVGRNIAGPIVAVTAAMTQLVRGDAAVRIPEDTRRDEIGTMVQALRRFRDSLAEADRLRAEQEAQREQAAIEKRKALHDMAAQIESEANKAVEQIGIKTKSMQDIAAEMRALAERTGLAASGASGSADIALANAQTVASATEELSVSILEISNRVNQSTAVVGEAVAAGSAARATFASLTERVGRIGAMADIIGDIAAKTNLLALNATIEAARAGDAGKGFAVVASEVKQLATQTARSTEEITRHINEVRGATEEAVVAVRQIETTIDQVNAISGSIAAAVEQQGAATAEIARNVTETAKAVQEMASRNAEVSQEAAQAGRYAEQVLGNTTELHAAMSELQRTMVHTVRTSTTEVDRRRSPRHPVDLRVRVQLPGHAASDVQMTDLSESGAKLVGLNHPVIGSSGSLRLEGIPTPIPFRIVAADAEATGVDFQADPAMADALRRLLARANALQAA